MRQFAEEWAGAVVAVFLIVVMLAIVGVLWAVSRDKPGLFYPDYHTTAGANLMATQMFELRADVHNLQTAVYLDRR